MSKFIMMIVCLSILTIGAPAFAEDQEIDICKCAIGVVMGKDPSIMSGKMKGDIPYVSYNRPGDGTLWRYKCKIEGGSITWAMATGRWRYEDIISYEIHGDKITVSELGGSTKSFQLTDKI